jgi:hypothetical protein
VPSARDFLDAKTFVMDNLSRLASEGKIYGAKIYGSVAFNMANERSDFDLLVITNKDSAIEDLGRIFGNLYDESGIDIEPKTILDRKSAETGDHTVNRIFYENIKLAPCAGNIAGEDPLEILKPANLTQFEEDELYLIKKRGTFVGGRFSHTSEEKNKVLQRVLEAPTNMGRKLLQMLPYLGYSFELRDISKKAVSCKFNEVFGRTNLMDEFKTLQLHDRNYTDLLKDAIKGFVGQKDYNECLDYLSEICIPLAGAWRDKIKLTQLKLLEGSFKMPEGDNVSRRGKEF